MRRGSWRSLLVGALLVCLVGLLPGVAAAHPLGNFTANTAAALTIRPDRVDVDYVVDLAEIPALRELQRLDDDGDGDVPAVERDRFAQERCAELATGIVLDVGARSLVVEATEASAGFTEGEAGLPLLRVECRFTASWLLDGRTSLTYLDTNTADRIGWREVTAIGDGTTLVATDVPERSLTDRLRSYPEDRLASPLDVRSADLTVEPGGASAAGASGATSQTPGREGVFERVTSAYTELVAVRELSLGFGLFALLVSLFLGAMHALAPGHGKTVMAAYVVGQRGTTKQALMIGLTVAVTHTLGVLGLGVAISASESLAPDALYPWLGALSGLLLVGIGVGLLRRGLRGRVRAHDDAHAHEHDHGPSTHTHGGSTHTHALPDADEPITWRSLVTLGVAGGLVPSPSALVVLLGAVALGRAWFGVGLVIAYGLGLAVTLVLGGLLLVRLRDRAGGWLERSDRFRGVALGRWLPTVTASLVVLGGLAVIARSVLVA